MRDPLSAAAIAVEWHRDRAVDIYKSRSLGRALCLPKGIEAENQEFPDGQIHFYGLKGTNN